MTTTSTSTSEYLAAPNRVVSAANGIDYAYRQVGEGTPALELLQRFRGNLDNWDMPVFVTNGDADPTILPHFSYLLAGLILEAWLKIYSDAAKTLTRKSLTR